VIETGGFPIKLKAGGQGEEILSEAKEARIIKGKKYLLENSIFGDVAVIRAHRADTKGNLQYRLATRNFNQDMATAAKVVIAEVDEIVEAGEIDPNFVHTPGIYVDFIVKSKQTNKPIEHCVNSSHIEKNLSDRNKKRVKIAKRVSEELKDGYYVNLGIGIPTLAPFFLKEQTNITIHSENGVLGVEGNPPEGEEDGDLINASKETISVGKGASFFSSSDSFGLVRGGHLSCAVLGAMEVSGQGDIANWIVPGKLLKGIGGAMDLVSCGSDVIIAMEHTSKGKIKLVKECNLPLTAKKCARLIITDLAVFRFKDDGFVLEEVASESNLDEIKEFTEFEFNVADNLKSF
jgi:3-oxoacid CoA-transferase